MRRASAVLTILQRAAFASLLACALLARLASPSGWMPAADGTGLVLCPDAVPATAHGPGSDHHATSGEPAKPDHPDGERGPCAFSAASLAMDGAPPPPTAPALPPLMRADALPLAAALAPGRGLAAPPPFATGPPLRA